MPRSRAKQKKEKPQEKPEQDSKRQPRETRLQQVLAEIKEFVKEKGYSPSIRELSAKLQVSHSAIAVWLVDLEKQGLITRDKRKSRSIGVV